MEITIPTHTCRPGVGPYRATCIAQYALAWVCIKKVKQVCSSGCKNAIYKYGHAWVS